MVWRVQHKRCRDAYSAPCACFFWAALWLFLSSPAVAAETFRGTIVTVSEIQAPPSSNIPFSIRIDADTPIPPRAMLVVRGLPPAVKFSEGRLFGPGVWVVSPGSLPRLHIQTSTESGRSELSFALVTIDGTPLTETKATLSITATASASATGQSSPSAPSAPASELSEADRAAALKLLEKGDASIKSGNVSIAREFYKKAANKGLAEGALALAATYDATELQRQQNVVGVQPDNALAKAWYAKARDLGSRDAGLRLKRFE